METIVNQRTVYCSHSDWAWKLSWIKVQCIVVIVIEHGNYRESMYSVL